jgi:uncharacterized protein (DUF927 family)
MFNASNEVSTENFSTTENEVKTMNAVSIKTFPETTTLEVTAMADVNVSTAEIHSNSDVNFATKLHSWGDFNHADSNKGENSFRHATYDDEGTAMNDGNEEETVSEINKDSSNPSQPTQSTTNNIQVKSYYDFINKKLIPATLEEIMNVPYKNYHKYATVIYYDASLNKGVTLVGGNNTAFSPKPNDMVLGMYIHDKNATPPHNNILNEDDVHTGAFTIAASVEDEFGKNFGLLIKLINKNNDQKLIYLSIFDIDNNKYIKTLLDIGFSMTSNPILREKFKKLLLKNSHKSHIDYKVPFVEKVGYSKLYHGFNLPDGLYLANEKKYTWFDADERYFAKVTPRGSYEAWKENIAKKIVKYPIPAFSLIFAFAAPLLQLTDLSTWYLHFYGKGSRGKTTLLQFATSVFANSTDPNGNSFDSFIQKWNSTNGGHESKARVADGWLGVSDELHMCDPKDFSKSIYTLCSGESKERLNGAGNAQKQHYWKFLALSSGEQSGFDKLSGGTKDESTVGRATRFSDIPIKKQMFTDFDGNELDIKEAGELAFNLKKECGLNFGHAGRDFIQQLLGMADSYEPLRDMIANDMEDMFQKLTNGKVLEPEEHKVMYYFALCCVAGNYAVMFDILPMTEDKVFQSVSYVSNLWLDEMAHFRQQKSQKENYVNILKKWLFANMTKFQSLDEPKPKQGCKGYYKVRAHGAPGDKYLIIPDVFETIFAGHKIKDVVTDLYERGILTPTFDKFGAVERYPRSYRVSSIIGTDGNSALVRLYTIDTSILDNQDDDAENDDEFDSKSAAEVKIDALSAQLASMQEMFAKFASMQPINNATVDATVSA